MDQVCIDICRNYLLILAQYLTHTSDVFYWICQCYAKDDTKKILDFIYKFIVQIHNLFSPIYGHISCVSSIKFYGKLLCLLVLIPYTLHWYTRMKLKFKKKERVNNQFFWTVITHSYKTISLNIYKYCHVHVKHWC